MIKNVVLKNTFDIRYTADVDEEVYPISENELIENIDIDDEQITHDLLKYLKSQNIEDNWGVICDGIKELSYTTDFDNSIIIVDMMVDTELSDAEIVTALEGFMDEYFSDKLSGSFTMNIEPIKAEPYEYDYNPLKDEIIYNTTTIDSITVDYYLHLWDDETISVADYSNK